MTPTRPNRTWVGLGLVWTTWILGLASALRYRWVVNDDAFISLRYARRLLDGKGLTWTDGEWVEGYSNLLWVLLTAALGATGMDLVTATRVLGAAGLFGLLWAISLDEQGRPEPRRALTGGLFAVATGGLIVWVMLGLSMTFFSALAVGLLVAGRRVRDGAGPWSLALVVLLAAALTLTRIDGIVLVGAVLVGSLVGGLPLRAGLYGVWGAAMAAGAQQVFRMAYYGDWVANTARVKVSFTPARAVRGARWVGDALLDNGVLVAVAVVAVVLVRQRRWLDAPVAALIWCAVAAWVGGDIFPGHRLLLPALALLALSVADLGERRIEPRFTAALAALAVVHLVVNGSTRANPWQPRRSWELATIEPARVLRERFAADDPLLAVDAAGSLPYHTGFRSVDMLGLTDRYLAMNPPPSWGEAGIGHDLGDGAYIWRRAPDIIAYSSGIGGSPRYLSALQLVRRPDFRFRYREVVIAGDPHPDGQRNGLYMFRCHDSPLGFRKLPRGVLEIPGWFFTSDAHPAVLVDGLLGPRLGPTPTELRILAPPGKWSVRARGTVPITVEPASLDLPPDQWVTFRFTATGPGILETVRLQPRSGP